MLVKMDEAVKLNTELKKEYESQLRIFKDLRENYEEKVRLLSGGESTILGKREENANTQTTGSENDKSSSGTPNTEISDYKVCFLGIFFYGLRGIKLLVQSYVSRQ